MHTHDPYKVLADIEIDIEKIETIMQAEPNRYARKGLNKLLVILKSWRDILDD